jgi:MtfA peptidase
MFPLPPPVAAGETKPIGPTCVQSAESWLAANVFHYPLLSDAERARLLGDVRTLVERKTWEGCGGLTVTDEMKATIAAQACLMLLGREHDHFGRVISILVYPSSFQVEDEDWQDAGWLSGSADGLAVYRGPVILAWDRVLAEGKDPSAGANVVIHEFAHQLDFIDRYADGTLDLPGEDSARWEEVLATEYKRLDRAIRRNHETFLGDYAATSKTEFFATASERFFTQPAKLRHYHPALYELLSAIYLVDPETWFEGRSVRHSLAGEIANQDRSPRPPSSDEAIRE